jgi:hypothetical protein
VYFVGAFGESLQSECIQQRCSNLRRPLSSLSRSSRVCTRQRYDINRFSLFQLEVVVLRPGYSFVRRIIKGGKEFLAEIFDRIVRGALKPLHS